MIKVEGYNLYYDASHLLSPKPKTYLDIVERLTNLDCKLFYNIVSSPECRYEKNYSEGRINDRYKNMSAENRFKNIFLESKLYANPKSYFVNKLNCLPKESEQIKSVSFTLCDYKNLHKHFDARGSEFGICFYHDFLQDKGIRPVEYINETNQERLQTLLFNSPYLLEVYNDRYDMRWEDEWRLSKDLTFQEEEIAFVIVPPEKHDYYLGWFMQLDGFEDIQILSSRAYTSFTDYLIEFPQQGDNSWNQIEIFRDSINPYGGGGFKVSPEDFETMGNASKLKFENTLRNELECFIKNAIQMKYESAYTAKYLRFCSSLRKSDQIDKLISNYDFIKQNYSEPDDSNRDLVRALYEGLFQHHPNY